MTLKNLTYFVNASLFLLCYRAEKKNHYYNCWYFYWIMRFSPQHSTTDGHAALLANKYFVASWTSFHPVNSGCQQDYLLQGHEWKLHHVVLLSSSWVFKQKTVNYHFDSIYQLRLWHNISQNETKKTLCKSPCAYW